MPLDQAGPDADVLASFRKLVRAALPGIEYSGLREYAVQFVDPVRGVVQLLPTSSWNDMTELPPVEYPAEAFILFTDDLTPGTTCLVAFADWNPAKPVIVARAGDTVRINAADILAAGLTATTYPVTIGTGLPVTKTLHGTIGVGK